MIRTGGCNESGYKVRSGFSVDYGARKVSSFVKAPIFIGNDLRGFAGAKAHCNDVGAKDPGYVGDTTDIFQE